MKTNTIKAQWNLNDTNMKAQRLLSPKIGDLCEVWLDDCLAPQAAIITGAANWECFDVLVDGKQVVIHRELIFETGTAKRPDNLKSLQSRMSTQMMIEEDRKFLKMINDLK